jgi:hypothetical protein
MESFYEYLIKIRHTVKERLLVALIWISAFFLTYLVVSYALGNPAFLGVIVLFIAGILYGANKLARLFDIEYEMIVVNKDLDVDKIIAKSSRKRMITVKLDKVDEYGEYTLDAAKALNGRKFDFKIVCANPDDKSAYVIYKHPNKGLALVVFAVNERLEAEVLKSVPRIVVKK